MTDPKTLTTREAAMKRAFDVIFAVAGLLVTVWFIVLAIPFARTSTGASGLFCQTRIGRFGKPFNLYKLRTMKESAGTTTVTTRDDSRITRFGRLLRRYKFDELPQLVNVLRGDMSFVGPRPDVAGFADCLAGHDRKILSIRPGITGPATLVFRDEEALLEGLADPEEVNRRVIYPMKVKINLEYIERYSFVKDIGYILQSVFGWPKVVDTNIDAIRRELENMEVVDAARQ